MAHWLALYPLSGSSRQEQLQVPQLPELSIFFWINMAPGYSKELADTEHRIWPQRLIKQRRRHQRLKSLPCISFHPFLQSLLHQNHTLPVRPPSQNHRGLLHALVVTEQSPGGTEHIHDSPCWQLTVQDGGAQGQSHWGQEWERCQISSSLQERNRLRELSEGLKAPQWSNGRIRAGIQFSWLPIQNSL